MVSPSSCLRHLLIIVCHARSAQRRGASSANRSGGQAQSATCANVITGHDGRLEFVAHDCIFPADRAFTLLESAGHELPLVTEEASHRDL
jgi:hypothetical protein